jgi:hypothetical protein
LRLREESIRCFEFFARTKPHQFRPSNSTLSPYRSSPIVPEGPTLLFLPFEWS